MEGEGGSLILILIGEVNFQTLIGEIDFLIQSVIKEEDIQFLMSLESLLLIGVLMLSHPYFGLIKLISSLTWSIFS